MGFKLIGHWGVLQDLTFEVFGPFFFSWIVWFLSLICKSSLRIVDPSLSLDYTLQASSPTLHFAF